MKKSYVTILLGLLILTSLSVTGINHAMGADLFWQADVSSMYDGGPVESPVLEFGKHYIIRAYGTFYYDWPNTYAADPQYYTTDSSNTWIWTNNFPAPGGHSFLQINETDVYWGAFVNGATPYPEGHDYSIDWIGEGKILVFEIVDWMDGDRNNNMCHFTIYIYEEPGDYYGATPGFWKNHPDAWPEAYTPGTVIDDIFSAASEYEVSGETMMDALQGGGGKGDEGAAKILLRAATAALLNAEHPAINYPETKESIIDDVNAALYTHDRGVILGLATNLDFMNNIGTPWE